MDLILFIFYKSCGYFKALLSAFATQMGTEASL